MPNKSKKNETKLLNQFKDLPKEAQKSLLDFCDFLSAQHPVTDQQVPQPKDLIRPDNESVVAAMRRLSDSYFMLDKDVLLHDASSLMSQHILQGRGAVEVINELEIIFEKFYAELIDRSHQTKIMDNDND